jgi:glyoxylase-like metal-dependent hydrolase (beta-lactamase superfamily II)
MTTTISEVAPDIYRLSTLVPDIGPTGFTFNQFLLLDEELLLFHTGHRSMFPSVREAIEQVLPIERLRWIAFGHVESDECGAMNEFLAAAPHSQVAHGALGCMVSIAEMADRPPRPLTDGEVLELGSKRVRHIDTPHVPHAWEAPVLYEETTATLLCGDLFTHLGAGRRSPTATSSARPPRQRTSSPTAAWLPRRPLSSSAWQSAHLEPWLSCTGRRSTATAPRPPGRWPPTTATASVVQADLHRASGQIGELPVISGHLARTRR